MTREEAVEIARAFARAYGRRAGVVLTAVFMGKEVFDLMRAELPKEAAKLVTDDEYWAINFESDYNGRECSLLIEVFTATGEARKGEQL
jgi:isocitrate dehydrogenase